MASKGAPQAGSAPNSTQMRAAPMSLRSAMRKYAAGGDVQGMMPIDEMPQGSSPTRTPGVGTGFVDTMPNLYPGSESPSLTAEQRLRQEYPDFASYDPATKIQAFNKMGTSVEDLLGMGVGANDLQWMMQNGFTPAQPMTQPAPTTFDPDAEVARNPYIGRPMEPDPYPDRFTIPTQPLYPKTETGYNPGVSPETGYNPDQDLGFSPMPIFPERPEFLEPPGFNFDPGYGRGPKSSYGDTPEDFGYNPTDFLQRSNPTQRKNSDVVAAILDALKSGRGTRDEQQKLMALLESIKGR